MHFDEADLDELLKKEAGFVRALPLFKLETQKVSIHFFLLLHNRMSF